MKDKVIRREHGYGGSRTLELIRDIIMPEISNPYALKMDDGAVMPFNSDSIVFTADSFVVSPCFFPGGDIGKIAVAGTVNDIIAQGGRPQYLSMTLILEEGFPIEYLQRIASSAAAEARNASVFIVCGDLKVVEKNKADGVYTTTSGVGEPVVRFADTKAEENDIIIAAGTSGDHGAAIFQARNGLLEDSPSILSDCMELTCLLPILEKLKDDIIFMRDPTRGGIAQVCIEIADMLGRDIHLEESNIPVKDWVRGLCGIAGLDHLYLPCEGNMIFLVREPAAVRLLDLLSEAGFKEASAIGKVGNEKNNPGGFVLTSSGGIRRLSGSDIAQIPRIC